MPRKQYLYHYIYKTTCKVTNRYYIGMHSTSNLEDNYFGSGKRLWNSIRKHGLENHTKEILEFLEDRNALKAREKEIVNEELLKDIQCMNLKEGGEGGFCSKEHQLKASYAGQIAYSEQLKTDAIAKEKWVEGQRLKWKNFPEEKRNAQLSNLDWTGRHHSIEGKKHISEALKKAQKGDKNSQFGNKWIFNEELSKSISIKQDLLEDYLQKGWKIGRKIFKQ